MNWATNIRLALALSRSQGVPFDRAWQQVERLIPTTEGQLTAEDIAWIRRTFWRGYHRKDVLKGRASILAERVPEQHRPVAAPVPVVAPDDRCRFGEPCPRERAEDSLMCVEHRDRLRAAMTNAHEGFKTRLNIPEPCLAPGCDGIAQTRVPYCARHDPELVAA